MPSTKLYKYATDAGTVGQIRATAATAAIAGNAEPAGAIDDTNVFAYASNPGSKKKKQLNARGVVLTRTVGTAPDTFVRRTFAPIFTKAALDAIAIGTAVTTPSGAWTVSRKIGEA